MMMFRLNAPFLVKRQSDQKFWRETFSTREDAQKFIDARDDGSWTIVNFLDGIASDVLVPQLRGVRSQPKNEQPASNTRH